MAVRAKAAALAGDIGGTKTVSGSPASRVDRRFRCATSSTRCDFKSLEDVAHDFLSGARAIDAACFYVPTPIAGGVSHPTHVAWIEYRIAIGDRYD
jgi:glucokinase